MKRLILFAYIFVCFLSFSSELRVFSDSVVFYPDKPVKFVGFNNANVFCDGVKVRVYPYYGRLNQKTFLSNLYNKRVKLEEKLDALKEKQKFLSKARSNIGVKTYSDIASLFKNADYFAGVFAENNKKIKRLTGELNRINDIFNQSAPENRPFFADFKKGSCKRFKIEFQGISFKTVNSFFFDKKTKTARVLKEIVLLNKSGIDIVADNVFLLNFSSKRNFYPIDFSPWKVREREEYVEKRSFGLKSAPRLAYSSMEKGVNARAVQLESRVYFLKNVKLDSNGMESRFRIKSKNVNVDLNLVVFPYADTTVYKEYSFSLPFEIDSNKWDVFAGKEVFKNVNGGFQGKIYRFFAGVDYSIKVERKRIVEYKEKIGFFNKKKVKKDGYFITLRNIGDRIKTIKVVDRVPVSVNEEIKVKDIVVKGVSNYLIDKKGKFSFKVKLKPGEIKKVEVNFKIEYPDGKEIFY